MLDLAAEASEIRALCRPVSATICPRGFEPLSPPQSAEPQEPAADADPSGDSQSAPRKGRRVGSAGHCRKR